MTQIDLSIIVPFYNEAESIEAMHSAIRAAVDPLSLNHEIIFVDDGSRDDTFQKARRRANDDPSLRVVRLRKNYGQTPAMTAGIDLARGAILVTMDGDLQNDPADIPLFLDKLDEGFDIVVGWRHKRQDKLLTRKVPSKVANWLIGKVTGVPIKDNGCSLKAYRAPVIKSIPLYAEMHRFLPAMLSLSGARIAEIKVHHHPRRFGTSKYGLSRIFKVLSDLLTIKMLVSFSSRPLRWFGLLSFISAGLAAAPFLWSVNLLLSSVDESFVVPLGLTMLFGATALFLFFCGVLSELVYRTGGFKVEHLSRVTLKPLK